MEGQLLVIRPQLEVVRIPAKLNRPSAVLWPEEWNCFGRLNIDSSALPASKDQISGQDRVRQCDREKFDAIRGDDDPVGGLTGPRLNLFRS